MTYKTCVTLAESNPSKLNSLLKTTLKRSDYVEIRFDFMKPNKVPIALNLVKKYLSRCICTLRPRSEGGKFSGSEKNRISILKLIAEYNPHLLDIEYNTIKQNNDLYKYLKNTKTNLLISWHDFSKTPNASFLKTMAKKMTQFSKNIKIVTTANSIKDTLNVLALYKSQKNTNLIAFAMGDYGRMSRILCTQLGSPYTYVSLGKPIAPGQFSLNEIKSMFKSRK
ncbi:MAG: type I 3-dehydroquinate dehydratase [Thaumarchaeota archaeon]|nr:MAG: type I 3-dehydroquinate dehydratase [Nitrososphaerota archaeon]TLX83084.1 MAG: type I 3-dehydroquinate dehydratase [Nitrososphaerota archaeon]